MTEALKISKIAQRLLSDLESIDEDTLTGESSHSRKMTAVLDSFAALERVIEERNEHQHKPAGQAPYQACPGLGSDA